MTAPFKLVASPLRFVAEADRPNLGDLTERVRIQRANRTRREGSEPPSRPSRSHADHEAGFVSSVG